MVIFNKEIFGEDAEWFLNQCCKGKRKWILENTNVTDENLIKEFLESKTIKESVGCLKCGKLDETVLNNFKNGNKSSGISKEDAEGTESVSTSGNDTKNSVKRQRKSKTKKN